ncbi:NAD(P)-binding protein [Durotheca rogersii]|uniref:NAD(P)-binding protein n=1 Tax=Durotheca rogersii TaxID=419775 RepID=UPI00221E5FFA|nr:NAD(P)-binding protein [Durotheca rogersii]KAI5863713.1 NAD(P)-binding protein [Durotheca rogersii]
MPSYLITGASRGIGFEFLRQLSEDPSSIVIGLVRDKASTVKKVASELGGRSNIHILQGDLINYASLKKAAEDTSKITGGSLDYLIANGAVVSSNLSTHSTLFKLGDNPKALEDDLRLFYDTNVVANIHLFNLFIPLIRRGSVKKVIAISTGMADVDLVTKFDIATAAPYALSKVGLNLVVAKYSAEFRSEGILFMSISPGLVNTSHNDVTQMTDEQRQSFGAMAAKFATYAPNFKGGITTEESVNLVLKVINNASVERGDGGSFVSQFGNRQWL